jgi:hypothetical protein
LLQTRTENDIMNMIVNKLEKENQQKRYQWLHCFHKEEWVQYTPTRRRQFVTTTTKINLLDNVSECVCAW